GYRQNRLRGHTRLNGYDLLRGPAPQPPDRTRNDRLVLQRAGSTVDRERAPIVCYRCPCGVPGHQPGLTRLRAGAFLLDYLPRRTAHLLNTFAPKPQTTLAGSSRPNQNARKQRLRAFVV